jgi:hypothetical protein
MGGGGSGGGGTTQSVSNQYSSLSPWAAPYVTSMLGAAQNQVFKTDPTSGQITGMNPYNAFGTSNGQGGQYGMTANDMTAANSAVAPFSQLQNQSFGAASNLQTPGQYGMATGAAGMGTMGALGAGQNLQNTLTSGNAMSQYMNPYIQNVLNPALQLSNQQYGIAGQQAQSAATGAGAFGGSRNALAQSLNQQNQMLANNQLIGNAYNTAYGNAQTQANNVANIGLQGNQAAITGGNTLANIGASQNATNLANIGVQNQYGQQQTAGQQAIINQAMQNYQTGQQYPIQQLTNLKNLASGIPVTDTTQVQQVAPPSTANLIGGAGMTGIGIAAASGNGPTTTINMNTPQVAAAKAGGIMKIKRMANGGIGSIVTKAIDDPKSVPDQSLKDGVIPKGLPVDLISALKTSESLQSKSTPQAPTSTVVQDNDAKLQQQVAQTQAVDLQKLQAALPTILADLKVQRDIAEEKGNKKEVKQIDMMMSEILAKAQEGQAQQMQPQSIQQLSQPQQAPQGIQQLAQPQQAPQQMAQAPQQVPQGIAGGGVIAFRKGGEVKRFFVGGTSAFTDDSSADLSPIFSKIGSAFSNVAKGTVNAMDPDAPAPALVDKPPVDKPLVEAKPPVDKPNNKIIIGDRAPSAPREPSAPVVNMDTFDVTKSTNNITKMVDNFSNMLMSQYNRDDSSKAISNALIAGGAAWGSHKGVGTGMGDAIGAFGPEYLRSTQAENERKDKLMGQYMALGMSGAGLQMQAQKLGIDAAEFKAKAPVLAAQARLYNAKANAPIGGVGLVAPGPINPSDLMKIDEKFDALKNNPKSDPAFYNSLPPIVQKQLNLSKDSAGYITGMQNVEKIVQDQKDTFIQRAHREGARYKTSRSSSDSDE